MFRAGHLSALSPLAAGGTRMRAAFDHLANYPHGDVFKALAPGDSRRVDVAPGVYAQYQRLATKAAEGAKLESHRKYADVQFVWQGAERIILAPPAASASATPYDAERDIQFHEAEPAGDVILQPGHVCVLMPGDLHAPGIAPDGAGGGGLSKIVLKVLVD